MNESSKQLSFSLQNGKPVVMEFNGGNISSDGGVLLLAQLDKKLGLSKRLAACFNDKRDASRVIHSMEDLFRTRILLMAQGYDDCDDADFLRHDPLFKTALDRLPETGDGLPSQPTLSRFEQGLILESGLRNRDLLQLSQVFLDIFMEQYRGKQPKKILLDLDGTDDPTYGNQQLSFYNTFYGTHCYIPHKLYATVDDEPHEQLIAAVLRPGNTHSSHGALTLLKRVVKRLRQAFPDLAIELRLDAGFAVPEIYKWCEKQPDLVYEIGLPRNPRLMDLGSAVMADARRRSIDIGGAKVRQFGTFLYQAKSWDKPRRVAMKAEILEKGENPRFVVTNRDLPSEALYDRYVGRGDSENRIKELKLDLPGGKTSCMSFKANQLRLLLVAAAYVLFQTLQRMSEGTALAKAQVGTIRERFLKFGAWVQESVRRVWIRFSSHFPLQDLFVQFWGKLQTSSA